MPEARKPKRVSRETPTRKRIARLPGDAATDPRTEEDLQRASGQDGYRTFSAPVVTNAYSSLPGWFYADKIRRKIF